MQQNLRLGLSGSLVSILCACGTASSPAKPATTPSPAAGAPLQQLSPTPELSPVTTPAGLVGVGRLARPGDLAKTLAGWVSLPFEPGMLDAIEPGLSAAVALDAPVEFAVVISDEDATNKAKPELVVSFGLSSTDRARALLEQQVGQKLVERGTAVYVTPEDANLHCAIGPSLGRASSRVVCSDRHASLEHLLPYATRGLPLENLGASDLHAELRIEPLRQKYGAFARMARTMAVPTLLRELSLADARFDRPLGEVAHAVGDELLDFFDDADKIAIDATASSKPEELALKFSMSYRGRASFISQVTADAQARQISPPGIFYELPADSAAVNYFAPPDPRRLEHPKALILGLLEGFLSHLEVQAPLRRDVRAAVDPIFNISNPIVSATGSVATPSGKAAPDLAGRLALALGWRVWGVEAPAAPFKDSLKTLARLSADKAFRSGVDKLLGTTAASSSKTADKKVKSAAPSEWVRLKTKSVRGMPTGSEVAVVEFHREVTKQILSRAKRNAQVGGKLGQVDVESLNGYFAVVPDGSRTWFVFAIDENTLIERANGIVSGSKAPRLSTRADLAQLRGQSALQAGFWTLLWAKGWLQLALIEKGKSAKEADSLISTLPHHAMTPMPFRAVVVGDDKRHVLELSTAIPKAVFDDAAAAVPGLMLALPD